MTPGVITIKNWKRHQHYKYRTPPWIKLHADLLTTSWYRTLSDNAARWLIELWLLARRDGGTVPYDSLIILREAGRPSTHKPSLDSALRELASASAITVAGADASASLLDPLAAEAKRMLARPSHQSIRDTEDRDQSSVTNVTGAAPRADNTATLTDGELMGLVRQHLYVPDGKAPRGYNDGRDVTVIRALRKCGLTGYQIADAIEGVRLMCDAGELGRKKPGEKLTMRALYNTGHGVRPLLYQAQEVVYKRQNQRPDLSGSNDPKSHAPEHIGATLDRLVPRKP